MIIWKFSGIKINKKRQKENLRIVILPKSITWSQEKMHQIQVSCCSSLLGSSTSCTNLKIKFYSLSLIISKVEYSNKDIYDDNSMKG